MGQVDLYDVVDFSQILEKLQIDVSNRNNIWNALNEEAVGQTLTEYIASVGTMLNFNLEASLPELFMEDPALESSVFKTSILLGLPPRRKRSAKTIVTLVLPQAFPTKSVTIAALSTFQIKGQPYYNPASITFPPNTLYKTDVILEQGLVTTDSFEGSGLPYQKFYVSSNFEANDNFLIVKVDNIPYSGTRRTLWSFKPFDLSFLETTQADGSFRIMFPSILNGTPPSVGSDIKIIYAKSIGASANTAELGLPVKLVTPVYVDATPVIISGETVTAISGGADKDNSEDLQSISPAIFASQDQAVSRPAYTAVGVQFPDYKVVDCRVWGEYELDPDDNTLMNVLNIVALPQYDNEITSAVVTTTGVNATYNFSMPPSLIPRDVVLSLEGILYRDDGTGLFVPEHPPVSFVVSSSTIDYKTGAVSVTFVANPTADLPLFIIAKYASLTNAQTQQFLRYMNKRKHTTTILVPNNAVPIPQSLVIDLFILPEYEDKTNELIDTALQNILNLYKRKLHCLGSKIMDSDRNSALKIPGVDYSEVVESLVSDLDYMEFVALGKVTITAELTGRR